MQVRGGAPQAQAGVGLLSLHISLAHLVAGQEVGRYIIVRVAEGVGERKDGGMVETESDEVGIVDVAVAVVGVDDIEVLRGDEVGGVGDDNVAGVAGDGVGDVDAVADAVADAEVDVDGIEMLRGAGVGGIGNDGFAGVGVIVIVIVDVVVVGGGVDVDGGGVGVGDDVVVTVVVAVVVAVVRGVVDIEDVTVVLVGGSVVGIEIEVRRTGGVGG
jgi:hypothetical protein